MSDEDVVMQAHVDQMNAIQRDHAEWCKVLHDSYIVAGFSPDHAFELLLRRLDEITGVYENG